LCDDWKGGLRWLSRIDISSRGTAIVSAHSPAYLKLHLKLQIVKEEQREPVAKSDQIAFRQSSPSTVCRYLGENPPTPTLQGRGAQRTGHMVLFISAKFRYLIDRMINDARRITIPRVRKRLMLRARESMLGYLQWRPRERLMSADSI